MPPRKKYLYKAIETTSFELLRKDGSSSLTARTIAKALNSSTMPIYSVIGSIEVLIGNLQDRALRLLEEYQQEEITDNPYLNQAIGYVKFAKKEQNLFRFLFIDYPISLNESSSSGSSQFSKSVRTKWFGTIDEDSMDAITKKLYFYVHGLAMTLAMGNIKPINDSQLICMLQEAGAAFLVYEQKINNGDKL